MSLSGAFYWDFPPIFVELGRSLGVYVVEQGIEPYIVISKKIEGYPAVAEGVYKTLYNFHVGLPDIYKLFPLKVFYEDLVPQEAIPLPEPEVAAVEAELPLNILPFRPARRWQYNIFYPHDYRTIGKSPH
jgi:hypothetical protein